MLVHLLITVGKLIKVLRNTLLNIFISRLKIWHYLPNITLIDVMLIRTSFFQLDVARWNLN